MLLVRHMLQKNRKLITTKTSHEVGTAARVEQSFRHLLQQPIARRVTHRVVHGLETVEVEREDCHVLGREVGEGLHGAVAKAAPVGKPGQSVVIGLVRERFLGRPKGLDQQDVAQRGGAECRQCLEHRDVGCAVRVRQVTAHGHHGQHVVAHDHRGAHERAFARRLPVPADSDIAAHDCVSLGDHPPNPAGGGRRAGLIVRRTATQKAQRPSARIAERDGELAQSDHVFTRVGQYVAQRTGRVGSNDPRRRIGHCRHPVCHPVRVTLRVAQGGLHARTFFDLVFETAYGIAKRFGGHVETDTEKAHIVQRPCGQAHRKIAAFQGA